MVQTLPGTTSWCVCILPAAAVLSQLPSTHCTVLCLVCRRFGFILPRVFTSNEKQPSNSRCIKIMYEGNNVAASIHGNTCTVPACCLGIRCVSGSLVVLPIIPILGLSTKLAACRKYETSSALCKYSQPNAIDIHSLSDIHSLKYKTTKPTIEANHSLLYKEQCNRQVLDLCVLKPDQLEKAEFLEA